MSNELEDTLIIIKEGFENLKVKISPIADINDLLIVRDVSDELLTMLRQNAKLVDVILEVSYN